MSSEQERGPGIPQGDDPPHPEEMLRMTVSGVTVDPFTRLPSLILCDESGRRCVAIRIGVPEASAISAGLGEVQLERPLPHDLLKQVLLLSDLELVHVEVHPSLPSLGDEFEAVMVLKKKGDGARTRLPARPSDAIAVALRLGGKILCPPSMVAGAAPSRYVDLVTPQDRPCPTQRIPPLTQWRRTPSFPLRRPKWRM